MMTEILHPDFIKEAKREISKICYWIETANPFANPNELTQAEVMQLKRLHNALVSVLIQSGSLDEDEGASKMYLL